MSTLNLALTPEPPTLLWQAHFDYASVCHDGGRIVVVVSAAAAGALPQHMPQLLRDWRPAVHQQSPLPGWARRC